MVEVDPLKTNRDGKLALEYLPHKELQTAEILLGVMKSQTGRLQHGISTTQGITNGRNTAGCYEVTDR